MTNKDEYTNEIMTGDNVEIMRGMADGIVDLTVTSPPYDGLRTYNGYSFDFESVAQELYRITKDGGVVVWVVGDSTVKGSETLTSFRQAMYFKEVGFNVHDTMIYEKSTSPFPQRNRYNSMFEYMFVLSKGAPKTYNLLTERTTQKKPQESGSSSYRQADGSIEKVATSGRKLYKTKGNIWRYAVGWNSTTKDKYAFEHPAMFPEHLANDHITSWSNPGDLVFDPFGGSGTTAKMALLNDRDYSHIDVSDEYNDIARRRIDEARAAKDGAGE